MKQKIREEFQDFADSIVWSNDAGDEKYIGVGNMADWWLERCVPKDKILKHSARIPKGVLADILETND